MFDMPARTGRPDVPALYTSVWDKAPQDPALFNRVWDRAAQDPALFNAWDKAPQDPALFNAWDKAPQSPVLAASGQDGPQTEARHTRPGATDRSRWHWLLVVAVVVPLLTPLYNRTTPVLFGIPFFYWSQLAFVVLASFLTFVVYQATKRRGRE